jgi:hypothetical protein
VHSTRSRCAFTSRNLYAGGLQSLSQDQRQEDRIRRGRIRWHTDDGDVDRRRGTRVVENVCLPTVGSRIGANGLIEEPFAPPRRTGRSDKLGEHIIRVYPASNRHLARRTREGDSPEIQIVHGRCSNHRATAVESGGHLARYLVYIDMNMVRAGVVTHPGQWPHCGYQEIQEPRKKNVLIDYERLKDLFGTGSYERLKESHQQWVNEYLDKTEKIQESEWTRSIAVGSQPFVESVKKRLGVRAKGREVIEGVKGYQLREEAESYQSLFEVKNSDIGLENAYPWDINA